jgi:regulator of sirC expression with transglutaminase-like and TPR domain
MVNPIAALDAMGQLPDAELDLADAALQFARAELPDADWETARRHLSTLAREAASITVDSPAACAAALAQLLAGRHGYHGDTATYDDLGNANLIRVVERRRGLPVSLGILWIHTARAAGWIATGVDFPAHFLIRLAADGTQVVVDPFDGGRVLGASALRALLKSVAGSQAELGPEILRPVDNRLVLLRLQNNIKLRLERAGDLRGALACTDRMLRLAPTAATLWREAALLHERLGEVAAGLAAWEGFVALVPDGKLAREARRTMATLRSRLN